MVICVLDAVLYISNPHKALDDKPLPKMIWHYWGDIISCFFLTLKKMRFFFFKCHLLKFWPSLLIISVLLPCSVGLVWHCDYLVGEEKAGCCILLVCCVCTTCHSKFTHPLVVISRLCSVTVAVQQALTTTLQPRQLLKFRDDNNFHEVIKDISFITLWLGSMAWHSVMREWPFKWIAL